MSELETFLHDWTEDRNGVKRAFLHLRKVLEHWTA